MISRYFQGYCFPLRFPPEQILFDRFWQSDDLPLLIPAHMIFKRSERPCARCIRLIYGIEGFL